MPDKEYLIQMQGLPLEAKVIKTELRIREWYEHWDGKVYVSFSGGKDSTVLAHIVHDLYPEVPLVFCNTGLEYTEIQSFARKMGAEFVRPKMQFAEVISTYGYPIIGKEVAEAIHYARVIKNGGNSKETDGKLTHYIRSRAEINGERYIGEDGKTAIGKGDGEEERKPSPFNKKKWEGLCHATQFKISHKCCSAIKKSPTAAYSRQTRRMPYIATLAEESRLRLNVWIKYGCNSYTGRKHSRPMSFWLEQDVLRYIKENGLEIASVYGDIVTVDADGMEYNNLLAPCGKLKCTGCDRTGCIFCGFGVHLEKDETRFQRLAKTHPKQYEYCMGGGQWVDNPTYDPTAPKMDGDWENWNPKKIWVPSKKGLGMKKVFDDCNEIYGKDFIRYE